MKLTNLLESLGRCVAYYPQLSKITGGIEANILFSQFCYWQGKERDPDGWMYQDQVKLKKETGLSADSQRTARAKLIERGLIEERYASIPRRLEFRIVPGALKQLWDDYLKNQVVPPSSDRRQYNHPSPQCIEARRKNPISSPETEQYQEIGISDIKRSDIPISVDRDIRSLTIYSQNYPQKHTLEAPNQEKVSELGEKENQINQEEESIIEPVEESIELEKIPLVAPEIILKGNLPAALEKSNNEGRGKKEEGRREENHPPSSFLLSSSFSDEHWAKNLDALDEAVDSPAIKRVINGFKGTFRSCSSDPWMKGPNVRVEILEWYEIQRRRDIKQDRGTYVPNRANLTSEIQNDYLRAKQIYKDFLRQKFSPRANVVAVEQEQVTPDFAEMMRDWHEVKFSQYYQMGMEKFIQIYPWANEWLEFVNQHRPELLNFPTIVHARERAEQIKNTTLNRPSFLEKIKNNIKKR